jgi:hypothetical protein
MGSPTGLSTRSLPHAPTHPAEHVNGAFARAHPHDSSARPGFDADVRVDCVANDDMALRCMSSASIARTPRARTNAGTRYIDDASASCGELAPRDRIDAFATICEHSGWVTPRPALKNWVPVTTVRPSASLPEAPTARRIAREDSAGGWLLRSRLISAGCIVTRTQTSIGIGTIGCDPAAPPSELDWRISRIPVNGFTRAGSASFHPELLP